MTPTVVVDNTIKDYIEAVEVLEDAVEESQTVFIETGTFGSDGWSISKSHKAFKND